jgi:hypothetical protein
MKPKKYLRTHRLEVRVDQTEMQEIIAKSHLYARGSVSDFVRLACLNYRPIKKVKVGK